MVTAKDVDAFAPKGIILNDNRVKIPARVPATDGWWVAQKKETPPGAAALVQHLSDLLVVHGSNSTIGTRGVQRSVHDWFRQRPVLPWLYESGSENFYQ
jgi:hypothetical protein